MRKIFALFLSVAVVGAVGCGKTVKGKFSGAKNEVKLLTLDPGHFHAALVQMYMYDEVHPTVHV